MGDDHASIILRLMAEARLIRVDEDGDRRVRQTKRSE